ncbi:MAG TPA: hypothetical protein VGP64_03885 [Polyangia bacterium]|jgi:hypothetical protein
MGAVNHRAIVRGFGLCMALLLGACSNSQPSSPSQGTVGFQIQGVPGVVINTVSWSITNAGTGFSRSGTVTVQSSNTIAFQVGALPSGMGYVVTLDAMSASGGFTCAGSASFAVTAGTTTGVTVTLACAPPAPDAGSVLVTGTTVVCATVASISAAPLETAVGSTITLAATATAGASAPTFAWTASAGTFDNAASATPVFTCPAAPGSVTLTAAIASDDPACGPVSSASVTVTCDTLDPTFTNVYANIIGVRCIGCHHPGGSGVTVGMLDMSTQAAAYADLVGVPAAGTGAGTSGVTCASLAPGLLRVSPSDASDSLIFEKVASKLAGTLAPCGSPMPLPATGAPLTQAQVDLVAAWINAGAMND